MIREGDIFESHAGRQRVVVYLVHTKASKCPAVFYDNLPGDGAGGSFIGPGAEPRFLLEFPTWIDRMRFEGAHQLYRKERERRQQLEARLDELERLQSLRTQFEKPHSAPASRLRRFLPTRRAA